jgi:hypothetical protein
MENYKEDTNHNFGAVFYVVLCFLFLLTFSGNIGNHTSSSGCYSSPNGIESGDISDHHSAILCNAISLPDLYRFCEYTLHNTYFNPFSFQNKLLDFNRRIAQNFVLVQKTRLSKGPVFPLRLVIPLPSNIDDDLPVLS